METSEQISKVSCKGLSHSKVAELLQPIIDLHGIEVKENRFEFAGLSPCVGKPVSEEPKGGQAIVPFVDISYISHFKARIEVLLESGELYTFSKTDKVRTHINTYCDGKDSPSKKVIKAQDIAGNLWDGLDERLAASKK